MIRCVLACVIFCGWLHHEVQAKPMDVEAASKLPEVRSIVSKIKDGDTLSQEDQEFLSQCIEDRDPVLLSAAAWVIGELDEDYGFLSSKLYDIPLESLDGMSYAFVRIAIEKRKAIESDLAWDSSILLGNTSNPYLWVELTRILLRDQSDKASVELEKMKQDERPFIRFAGESLSLSRLPSFDERYKVLLKIISDGQENPIDTD